MSDLTFTFHFHALEKEMATHSSVLAWRIPGTGEPGGLPSMESYRVRHDWSGLAAAAATAADVDNLIPGLGRSPGGGKGYPLQHSSLEPSMDYIVHGVAKSQTELSNFHFHFHFPLPFLNPAWTSGISQFTHCWNLAWRILSVTLLACKMSAIVQ